LRHQAPDLLIMLPVGVLGPRIEAPFHGGDLAILGLPHPCRAFCDRVGILTFRATRKHKGTPGISRPNSVCWPTVKTNIVVQSICALQSLACEPLSGCIFDNEFDALVPAKIANDLRIDPRNRLEFPRPIQLVMRPRKPGGSMRLPFGGHTKGLCLAGWCRFRHGGQSINLLVIGAYASIRRSRRKGQLRRVSSITRVSTSPSRISSLS
jgi:hypothetical protein